MKSKAFLLMLLLAVTLPYACKKGETSPSGGGTTVQGNVTLTLRIMHHSWGVSSIPVYLKFNTTQWPGKDTTKYDLMQRADREGYITFTKMGPGDLVAYAAGFDSVFQAKVLGYRLEHIATSDANKTVTDTMYVSE